MAAPKSLRHGELHHSYRDRALSLRRGRPALFDPPGVDGRIVVWVLAVALAIDLITAAVTYRMSNTSMNIRAAFLHNLSDALSSVAVFIAGTVILLFDWRLIDPIVTIGIASYILWLSGREIVP